jgi:hypothetical protein
VIRRKLAKRDVEAEPFRVWNEYVGLLAMEDYRNLDLVQRPAHLVFWYENEVQNGGHLQYFENRGTAQLAETIEALGLLGAVCQQRILQSVGDLFLSRLRSRIESVEQYCEIALQGEFSSFDSQFGECTPSLQECLEGYLARNTSSFVTVED